MQQGFKIDSPKNILVQVRTQIRPPLGGNGWMGSFAPRERLDWPILRPFSSSSIKKLHIWGAGGGRLHLSTSQDKSCTYALVKVSTSFFFLKYGNKDVRKNSFACFKYLMLQMTENNFANIFHLHQSFAIGRNFPKRRKSYMHVLEYNDPPKLECVWVPVMVNARVYVTYFFVSSQANSST